MKSKQSRVVRLSSAKSDDQPATRKMLKLVRTELIQRMDAGFNRVDARFNEVDARFSALEAKFEARFGNLEASNARMELLLEEQSANNRIVLEGLQALWQRQDHLETRLDRIQGSS